MCPFHQYDWRGEKIGILDRIDLLLSSSLNLSALGCCPQRLERNKNKCDNLQAQTLTSQPFYLPPGFIRTLKLPILMLSEVSWDEGGGGAMKAEIATAVLCSSLPKTERKGAKKKS